MKRFPFFFFCSVLSSASGLVRAEPFLVEDGNVRAEIILSEEAPTRAKAGGRGGQRVPREFPVDPGWERERFPDHAVSHRSPGEIAAIYEKTEGRQGPVITSFPPQENGALRIVGTGHSFMTPGYGTLKEITQAAGFEQPLLLHTSGGITGSARYKWEQENGIFQFDGKPTPKLLASIANAEWDAMMWGPYFQDRLVYYSCWIDFSLHYNPEMKFYLSDAWPQLYQFEKRPQTEDVFTNEKLEELGAERSGDYMALIRELRKKYSDRVFILPTCDAMVLAGQYFLEGKLPGVEGIHRSVGEAEERALWRDPLGHLGPGFEWLEGYVFYATLYGKSPERIESATVPGGHRDFPGPELDRVFREIAWKAVVGNPLTGVTDRDGDGLADPPAGGEERGSE